MAAQYSVKQIPLSKIIPYARNPRLNDKAVDKVAASMKEFGFRQPIVVDEENVIIVGHTRYLAAQKLGLKSAPVHTAIGLTKEQVKAYRIADNRTHEESDWDNELLSLEIGELEDAGFDLGMTGFDTDELAVLLDGSMEDKKGNTGDDDIPPVPKKPVNRRGDVWVLGKHRLMCGDTTNAMDMAALMEDDMADLLWIDPPYNVAYESGGMSIENDDMGDDEFSAFLLAMFMSLYGIMKEGGCFYVAHSDVGGTIFRDAVKGAGFMLKQTIIWVKNTAVLSRQDYNWRHEPILYGWKPGAGHYFGQDFTMNTVIEEDTDFEKMNKDKLVELLNKIVLESETTVHYENKPTKNDVHPTMKPVALVQRHIKASTRPGEIVIDGCGGSGSTLIAAEKIGRIARIMEFDPVYADVIVTRWQEFTGQKAMHANGKSFDALSKTRKRAKK